MRREFCYLPDEFTETLIAFGNVTRAWCYIQMAPGVFSKIEFASNDVKKAILQKATGSISLFVGFESIVSSPIWNKEEKFQSLDLIASYAIHLLIPQFNLNKSVLSFGYMATFDKNRFENSDTATELMNLCTQFCKLLGKIRTREYVIQSLKGSHIWENVWVSKNVAKHSNELQFSQFIKVRDQDKADFRLVKVI